ncbi:MAG: mechanosensitive ion channel family protein [Treponema sp.]
MNDITETAHAVSDAAAAAASETVGKVGVQFADFAKTYVTWENLFKAVGALIVIALIYLIFAMIRHAVKRIPPERLNAQQRMLVKKIINYAFYVIVIMYALTLFGIKLSAIWGAAGIAGIAIGFAAQTSVSNLISGLFVLGEKTMKVGDFITVGGQAGTVDSIGLLSVKAHTKDNQMIRIPNSTIINSNFVNNSFFDKRRMTFAVSIDYNSDMPTALEALQKVPSLCPTVLAEPAPAAWFDGFGDSGIDMTLAVWFNPSDFLQTKNDVFIAIKRAFDEAAISIPFNRLDVAIVGETQGDGE